MSETSARAPRMQPDERREMLIAATAPLVAAYGPKVTTRQIADAAGVAEGTIFRAFPDKDALVRAAITRVLDQTPVLRQLAVIDLALPLRERLTTVVDLLQRYMITLFNVVITHGSPDDIRKRQTENQSGYSAVQQEIARILEPDQKRFRCSVRDVEQLMWILTIGGSHPIMSRGHILTPAEIISALLDGTLHERERHRC